MSDWERGARNAVKTRFPGILLRGCHFHYSQSVWRKIQRLGLSNAYHSNSEFKTAVRCFMALPFLPEDQIRPIYNHLNLEDVILTSENMNNFTIFKNYIRKQWINGIPSNELSVFNCRFRTNNGAENYHGRLKKDIVVAHPRIWLSVEVLNNTIQDTDLDIERLSRGIDITRTRKLKNIQKDSLLTNCREKLVSGEYDLVQYVKSIANSIQPQTNSMDIIHGDLQSDSSIDDDDERETHQQNAACCVCLLRRETTVAFLPCRHAKCCENCSVHLEQCPMCRSTIEERFQIYT